MATTMKLIAKNVLGSDTASVTFSSIPGNMADLVLIVSARSAETGYSLSSFYANFNGSSTNYSWRALRGTGSAAESISFTNDAYMGEIPANNATASTFGNSVAYIPNYAGSTNKSMSVEFAQETNASTAYLGAAAILWSNTSAIDQVAFKVGGAFNFKSGSSFYLYGITKA